MLREKFSEMSEGILIHEAKRRRAKEFGKKIEEALDYEEKRNHTGHLSSAKYNKTYFGFMHGSHEYFFEELILGDSLSSYPYKDRFETHKGDIVHTRIRTDGNPVESNSPIVVSGKDLRKIDRKLENIKNGIFN